MSTGEHHCLMMIAPDHARILAEQGYSNVALGST